MTETVNQELEEKRNIMSALLRNNVCNVTFTKVNGEERVMPCTLDPNIVPPAPAPKVLAEGEVAKVKKVNPETMSVWCMDKKEWRSFRVANVTSITISE